MQYNTSLDLTSRIVTILITLLFLVSIGFAIYQVSSPGSGIDDLYGAVFSTVLLLGIYFFCYLYRPMSYIISEGKLVVKRPIKDVILNLSELKQVRIASKQDLKLTIRTFGNGGLFGFYGKFRNSTFGNMTWYATRLNNYLILFTTNAGKIVLTPDDIEGMFHELKMAIPETQNDSLN